MSGNKYRKLTFLFDVLEKEVYKGVVSFGGPHSNHIHALAYICNILGLPLTLFVRSHGRLPHTPTLKDAEKWGAKILGVSSEQYRYKEGILQHTMWKKLYHDYIIIPEGGSHPLSMIGIDDMMAEIEIVLPEADFFICPVGTGATMGGMVRSKKPNQRMIGISALKSSVLHRELQSKWNLDSFENWFLAGQWHFGGYGQAPEKLKQFISKFESKHGIQLDLLYNGKAMYALHQYLEFDLIPPGSKVVFLHTGGLQGLRGG